MTSKTTTKFEPNHFSLKGHHHGLTNDKLLKLSKERIDKHINFQSSNPAEEQFIQEVRNSDKVLGQKRNSDSNLQMESGMNKGSG